MLLVLRPVIGSRFVVGVFNILVLEWGYFQENNAEDKNDLRMPEKMAPL